MSPKGGFCNEKKESHVTRKLPNMELTSSPSKETASSLRGTLEEILKCPVCMDFMHPPIHQCPIGHTICSSCKARVRNRCLTCHQALGNIRCLALEKIAESLDLPCRYQSFGCNYISTSHSRLKHEKNCEHRPFNCPYERDECSITGDIPFLVMHLKNDHKVSMHDGCDFEFTYLQPVFQEFESGIGLINVFNCFDRHFCLHFESFKLDMAPVYMIFLRLMGEDDEETKFSYSLEVGSSGRKLIWQGIARSIRDSRIEVRKSLEGLIIHSHLALIFSGGNRKELNLKVTGRIWEENLDNVT